MQTTNSHVGVSMVRRKTKNLVLCMAFLMNLGFISTVMATDVTINAAWTFSSLDGSIYDADGLSNGTFTVNGSLVITGTGSVSSNTPGSPAMKFAVSGDFTMEVGARISGDVSGTSSVGTPVELNVGGAVLLHGDGTDGAKITSNQAAGSCNGGHGGKVTLSAANEFTTETGSVISANAKCTGGEIKIFGTIVDIQGLVESTGGVSGTGINQPPGGGPISIIANCTLTVNDRGKVSSLGFDPGADLVHLEACTVNVYGLVQSTGTGHATPSNPKTKLVPPYRPDKPATSTAGVEIWGNEIVISRALPHNGEVNADLTSGGGNRSWIDILARESVVVVGRSTGNFAVHANNAGNLNTGGIITVKSSNTASATLRSFQSNGAFGGAGGPVTIEGNGVVNLSAALSEAKGASRNGGAFSVKSYNADIQSSATTNFNVSGSPRGTVSLTECGLTAYLGSVTPNPNAVATTGSCGGAPTYESYVVLPAGDCRASQCREEQTCPCIECSGLTVVVDQNVTINLALANPYSGDPDLKPYFSFDKTGADPSKWKAIFNLGTDKLLVKSGATITVSTINGAAPGIVINENCELEVEQGGKILVTSSNKNAGDIVVTSAGTITVNGEIRNQVLGTIGLPGAITATSKCGNFYEGQSGLIQILGIDGGGNTISLVTCAPDCDPAPNAGDITINGLVKSYAHAHAGPLTLNRPNIRVASFNGAVTVNANTAEPLFDEFSNAGGLYDIYGGLLSWVRDNVNPGKVEVQAKNDIIVNGHGIDPTGPVRTSFGAIAAKGTASNAPGGLIDLRSLEGNVVANDRALDVKGRNLLATNFAHINVWAKQNISFNRPGANNNFNPVVDASGFGSGDRGGLNTVRSFSAGISVGTNALVTAAVPAGSGTVQGSNQFGYCTTYTNNGTVTPAPVTTALCSPDAPQAKFIDCLNLDNGVSERSTKPGIATVPVASPEKTMLLQNFPNPFTQSTSINYVLASDGFVTVKVINSVGKEVATLVNGKQAAGTHQVTWYAPEQKGGVYYVHLTTANFSGVNKVVMIK